VQQGAVVPDQEIALAPGVPVDEARLRREVRQLADEGAALVLRPADDM
jgi:hypothetical protein